jgi:hypothetical protein
VIVDGFTPKRMTDGKRSIRQISGNLQKFQPVISEFDAVDYQWFCISSFGVGEMRRATALFFLSAAELTRILTFPHTHFGRNAVFRDFLPANTNF